MNFTLDLPQWIIQVQGEDVKLAHPDLPKDEDKTYPHQKQRQSDQATSYKECVGEIRGPVPDTLVALQIKCVVAPAYEIRELEQEGKDPAEETKDDGDGPGVDTVVSFVVADKHVTVDGQHG